jgi:hypothetical protein
MLKAYPILNLIANIHFKLQILVYNTRGVLIQKYTPFYKILYYYFSIIVNINLLYILIFFLAFHLKSNYKHSTYLSKEDE